MTDLELYNAIYKRKSIRKYDMTPLKDQVIEDIRAYTEKLKPLDESIAYTIEFIGADDVKFLMPVKLAPHYICIYSEKKEGYLMNAGYLLQQVDLYLSANGIGSLWFGMAKPSKEIHRFKDGLEFVILLAFGKADEQLHRENTSEFNRKGIKEITSINGSEQLLEPVRLAPSATNSQPWFFSGNTQEIIVSRKKLNFIKDKFLGNFNQVDIGISLYHLWLSLKHEGKTAVYDCNKAEVPDGYEFMIRVKST
jgi:nitroreductase